MGLMVGGYDVAPAADAVYRLMVEDAENERKYARVDNAERYAFTALSAVVEHPGALTAPTVPVPSFVAVRFTREDLEEIYSLLGSANRPSQWVNADRHRRTIRAALSEIPEPEASDPSLVFQCEGNG